MGTIWINSKTIGAPWTTKWASSLNTPNAETSMLTKPHSTVFETKRDSLRAFSWLPDTTDVESTFTPTTTTSHSTKLLSSFTEMTAPTITKTTTSLNVKRKIIIISCAEETVPLLRDCSVVATSIQPSDKQEEERTTSHVHSSLH